MNFTFSKLKDVNKMGSCRIGGKYKDIRDIHGNTPNSKAFLNKAMDRWRKKQESLKNAEAVLK
jgi:hypothetical protein